MKKTLTAIAVTGLFATTAHAQSSVTLYGLIDAAVTYTNNQHGHANWQQQSGSFNGNRWGLRGVEDLGGGLKAIFTLESGFNINTGASGQGGRLFGRQAFAGLSSDDYGTVTLGRQYDEMHDFVQPLAFAGDNTFQHPFDNDNLNNSVRFDNTVKYTSVNYAGFRASGMYSFSNSTEFASNRAYSFGAGYTWGAVNLGAAYLQVNGGTNSASAAGALADSGGIVTPRQRTFGAGASYAFGPAKVGLVYSQTNLSGGALLAASETGTSAGYTIHGGARFQNIEANASYTLTPALALEGSYTYTHTNLGNLGNPNFQQANLRTVYSFSKRTNVYLQGAYQHVSGNPGDVTAVLNPTNGGAASSTRSQVIVSTGVRHSF